MRILLCAATSIEARACRQGIAAAEANPHFEVLQTGMGQRLAETALRAHLKSATLKPDWIISTGFAGSHQRSIELGSWILGKSLSSDAAGEIEVSREYWERCLNLAEISFKPVQVHTVPGVITEESRDALASHTQVLDMETFALAQVARDFAIPFQVVRLISDTRDQPIPKSITEFSEGMSRGLFAAARDPRALLRFVVQTAGLPAELKRTWEKLSKSISAALIISLTLLGSMASLLASSLAGTLSWQNASAEVLPPASARIDNTDISVERYLNQVEHSNDAYRSLSEDASGAKATAKTADLLFKPEVFTTAQFTYDPRDTHVPSLEGDRTLGGSISTGLREQTPWGLQLQLSLDYNQNTLLGISSPLVTRPTVTNLYPVPIFNWSLWQNFGGKLDQANQKVQVAQSLAQIYGSDFSARALLVEAEGRYWKLASLREVIRLQRDSLTRAHSVQNLDTQKARQRLIDSGDTLLSEAAVQGKELELRSMLSEERSAARLFNASRGVDSDEVSETLPLPDAKTFAEFKLPTRTGPRGDLKVAEQQSLATEAGYTVAHEKLLPNVSLFGSIFALGVNFSMPLDQGLTSDARKGYENQAEAASLSYRRKQFESENEWTELVSRFQDNLERLKLAVKLEDLQRRKFEDARKRRARAMTVAFQVFQYELDYLAAAQTRLQIEGTLLGLRAQAKLYADAGP